MLITHDLGVIAEIADRVMVLYAGRVAEMAPVRTIFDAPAHPYTQVLLASIPDIAARRERLGDHPWHGARRDWTCRPAAASRRVAPIARRRAKRRRPRCVRCRPITPCACLRAFGELRCPHDRRSC